MSFSVVAYRSTIDASAALTNIASPVDPHVRVVGNYIYIPSSLPNLLGVYAHAVTPVRTQLRSPSLRMVFNQEIGRMGIAVTPDTPVQLCDYFESPIPLIAAEPLEALMMAGAGAQYNDIVVFLGEAATAPVKGAIRTILANSATTSVVNVWTNVPIVFADLLPAGRYQVVGLKAISAHMCAARLLFAGQYPRPGCVGSLAISHQDNERFRYGNSGVWGEFQHDVPPTIDILTSTADAAQTYMFDLIKVG
jgi:hypothetical protein